MSFILDFLVHVNAKVDQVKQQASSAVKNASSEFQGLVGIGIAVVVLLIFLLTILIVVQIKKLYNKKKFQKKLEAHVYLNNEIQDVAYREKHQIWTVSNETQV